MEECRTPTFAQQMMEFKFEVTPTMVFDPTRLQEAQNLFVNHINVRCFTPTVKNFQSPGLSPINETLAIEVATGVAMGNVPATIKEEHFKAPIGKPKLSTQQQQQQLQQQFKPQQNFYSKHFISDSPPVFTLNSTVDSEADFSAEIASPDSSAILGNMNSNNNTISNNNNNSSGSSNTSGNNNSNIFNQHNNTTNFLDCTMNISTLLRSIGLEEYIEPFEQHLDLEQFLNIQTEDFLRLGVRTVEHQQKIADLLSKFNA